MTTNNSTGNKRNTLPWAEYIAQELAEPDMAMDYLKVIEEELEPGDMARALQTVLQLHPQLTPLVVPAYARYLSPAELDSLTELACVADFVKPNRHGLLRLMSHTLAEAS